MSERAVARWYEPRTLGGMMALASVIYMLFQPAFQLVLVHWLLGDSPPFATPRAWAEFILVCGGIGAGVGACFFAAMKFPPGSSLRAWGKANITAVAMGVANSADRFSLQNLGVWLVILILSSAVTGALLTPLYRWSDRAKQRRPAAEGGPSHPGAPLNRAAGTERG